VQLLGTDGSVRKNVGKESENQGGSEPFIKKKTPKCDGEESARRNGQEVSEAGSWKCRNDEEMDTRI